MEPAYADEAVMLYHGKCEDVLPSLPEASVDAVVCDPPYGLEFMGREWDTFRTSTGAAKFSKSGSGSVIEWPSNQGWNGFRCRTCGRLGHGGGACACENPDFRHADGRWHAFQAWCEAWAAECLRLLRPNGYLLAFGGTRTYHRMACGIEDAGFDIRDSIDWLYGSGFPKNEACLKPAHEPIVMARKPARRSEPLPGLEACRVEHADAADLAAARPGFFARADTVTSDVYGADRPQQSVNDDGRWPPNVLLSSSAAAEVDRQADAASRIFPVFRYEPKAPASERPQLADGTAWPTVKPLDLMRWLVRLVTPPDGVVLDPFCGSGTTAEACIVEGFSCITIDRDPVAIQLAMERLRKPIQPVMFGEAS